MEIIRAHMHTYRIQNTEYRQTDDRQTDYKHTDILALLRFALAARTVDIAPQ